MSLFFAIALLFAFYLLLIGEFLLPTGGSLGFGAAVALVSMLVISFSHSVMAGVVMSVIVLFSTPLLVIGLVKVWPHTPIGRRILNRRPGQTVATAPQRTTTGGTKLDDLVGQIGIAKSPLLPSGRVVIGGDKIDASSTGMPIDAGSAVVVVRVLAGRVQVRLATDDDLAANDPTPKSPPSLEQSL
ncbi:MAG: NfeD family protein, partial [Rubripirellula sp.]